MDEVAAEGEEVGTPGAPDRATEEGGGAAGMAGGAFEEEIGGGATDERRGFFSPRLVWRVCPPLPEPRR